MDLVMGFLISTNKISDTYNLILVIIDRQIIIVYCEMLKVTINVASQAKNNHLSSYTSSQSFGVYFIMY